MSPSCSFLLVVLLCILNVLHSSPDGYNLEALIATAEDSTTRSSQKMELIKYIINLKSKEKAKYESDKKIPILKRKYDKNLWATSICHTDECQAQRMKPQWLVSYYEPLKACIVWIYGTDPDSRKFDWQNGVNVVPKTVEITDGSKKHNIQILTGTYKAVNTPAFYEGIPAKDGFSFPRPGLIEQINACVTKNDVSRITLSGHSQGGSIATVIALLWKGKVVSPFTTYIKDEIGKEKVDNSVATMMDNAQVFTFGSFTMVGHDALGAEIANTLFGKDITNVINALDPIPMIYSGTKEKGPDKPFPKSTWFVTWAATGWNTRAQGLVDNYAATAYCGPVGHYIVLMKDKGKHVVFRSLNPVANKKLFQLKLTNGANTFKSEVKDTFLGSLKSLWAILKHHTLDNGYVKLINAAVPEYEKKLKIYESGARVRETKCVLGGSSVCGKYCHCNKDTLVCDSPIRKKGDYCLAPPTAQDLLLMRYHDNFGVYLVWIALIGMVLCGICLCCRLALKFDQKIDF